MFGKGTVVVLPEKTKETFGYDISVLHPGSHQRVWLKCTRCDTEIIRDFRHTYKKHACPTHCVKDGVDHKWCNACLTWKSLNHFQNNAAKVDGKSPTCRDCRRINPKTISYKVRKLALKRSTIEGWIAYSTLQRKYKAKKHGIPHDLNIEYLIALWHKQGGRCYYTKIPLEFGKNTLHSAQLDRLDSTKGYIKDNVVWASRAINHMKNSASMSEFQNFIAQMSSVVDFGLPSFEFKKLQQDATLPTLGRPTDACHDVYSIDDVLLQARSVTDVKTGLCLSPPTGFYLTIEGRSSLFKFGIEPLRGVIDATYTGELVVTLNNTSNQAYAVKKGDRIAQIAIHRVIHAQFTQVEEFSLPYRTRGNKGFGSSGR